MSVRKQTRKNLATGESREFWIVDVDFQHPNGRKERVRKVARTRREAEQLERTIRDELVNPTPAPKVYPTLERFVTDRWLPNDVEATNRESTITEKRSYLRVHIVPQLGKLTLDQISAERISAFLAYLRKAGLSPKSSKHIVMVVRRILACAVEWDVIDRLPKFPRIKTPEARWDFFTRAETDHLLSKTIDPLDRALLLFAFHTGARSGEQLAIAWGDIDWHNRLVVFRSAFSRKKLGTTKDSETRKVPLTPALEAALRELQRTGKVRSIEHDLIFCQDNGQPFNVWHLRRVVERACKRAGLRVIRRHDTRHSFASQLVMAGVPLPRVQEWLGHSSIAMTMRYAHLAPSDGGELIKALDSTATRAGNGNLTATLPEQGSSAVA